ncbi:MAG: hypothetical protein NT075_07215 [Chloroflexi bacterium]|nr:hypothetical protein [Chloroflexota bacterium]
MPVLIDGAGNGGAVGIDLRVAHVCHVDTVADDCGAVGVAT